ncbi:hypothetical protein ACLOJK_012959 [Asimina triloba]
MLCCRVGANNCYCWLTFILRSRMVTGRAVTDPHPPSPTSAPPRVIYKVHLAATESIFPAGKLPNHVKIEFGLVFPFSNFRSDLDPSFGLFKTHQSGIKAVDRPPPLPENTLPKSQPLPLPPPLPSPEKKMHRKGVGYLHSSLEKKEHRISGTPAEHCADFFGTPAPRQQHSQRTVSATSVAQSAPSQRTVTATSSAGSTFGGPHF